MNSIIITYDLVGTDETSDDYERLIDHIKSGYSNWAKVALSTWIIRTELAPADVRDNLDGFIDGDDRLFVARLSGAAAWRRVLCSNKWLKEHL